MVNFELTTDLLPHQKAPAEKLKKLKVGALFMDMGTGKTRTIIDVIHSKKDKICNVVYFCPVNIKRTIYLEFLKHTSLKEDDIVVIGKQNHIQRNKSLYIIGIESIQNYHRTFFLSNEVINRKSIVIIDESHYVKSYRSNRFKRLEYLLKDSVYKFIMTGTPVTKNISDLFTQMKLLSSKILGYNSFYSFSANHLEYSDKYKGLVIATHNEEELAWRMSPYVYQVTKEEYFNLPDKTYSSYCFELSTEQNNYYNKVKNDILTECDDLDSYTIFRLFSYLQQITCGFCNYPDKNKPVFFENARADILIDVLLAINKDKKIIIWVKYANDVISIKESLIRINKDFITIESSMSLQERGDNLSIFKSTDVNILIINQKIGSVGLTINEAVYSIFYNNSFNYADRVQAEARNYRVGQQNKVHYIDLYSDAKICERIRNSISNKEGIIKRFKEEIDAIKDDHKLKNII